MTDDRFREDNERRVERMSTWIELAKATSHDHVRFVFYWIAYEAAYQNENSELKDGKERQKFHERLAHRDRGKLRGILHTQTEDVVRILELRQVHSSFWTRWREDEDVRSAAEWERRFRNRVGSAIVRAEESRP